MDDLSSRDPRKLLSKSFLTGADLCQRRAWLDLYDPKPFRMNERVAYGKAVDLGVQFVIGAIASGAPVEAYVARMTDAMVAVLDESAPGIEVDVVDAVEAALAFAREVAPRYDLSFATTQHSIRLEIPGIGGVDGHPDVILRDGSIFDVKTAGRAKAEDAASGSKLELGFYVLLREAETGVPVPRVGYWTWVRSKKPYWQVVEAPVTDTLRAKARERAVAYRSALVADTELNAGQSVPVNYAFPGGPAFPGLCGDCAHNPSNAGSCTISEETR